VSVWNRQIQTSRPNQGLPPHFSPLKGTTGWNETLEGSLLGMIPRDTKPTTNAFYITLENVSSDLDPC